MRGLNANVTILVILCILMVMSLWPTVTQAVDMTKHRLIILADMGNEPDEERQISGIKELIELLWQKAKELKG